MFREVFSTLEGDKRAVLPARVKAVNASANTCTVVLEEGGAEHDDVRLTASADDATDRLLVVPALNSRVLVGVVDGEWGDFCLLVCDKVDEVQFKLGNLTLKANADGVNVTRGTTVVNVASKVKIEAAGVSLKAVLNNLVQGVQQATYINAGGVPTPLVDTSTKLATAATQLNSLLE